VKINENLGEKAKARKEKKPNTPLSIRAQRPILTCVEVSDEKEKRN
jgi:hypothetical protein